MKRSALIAAILAISLSACGQKPTEAPAPAPALAPAPAPVAASAPEAASAPAATTESPAADSAMKK